MNAELQADLFLFASTQSGDYKDIAKCLQVESNEILPEFTGERNVFLSCSSLSLITNGAKCAVLQSYIFIVI